MYTKKKFENDLFGLKSIKFEFEFDEIYEFTINNVSHAIGWANMYFLIS